MNHSYSLEAEQAILGSLLLDNTTWPEVQDRLSFKDFYRREHQVLFDVISKKLELGECVDALTLSNEVKGLPELKEVNGEIYVLELLNKTYSTANIASYVEIVKAHSQRRQFKEILNYLDHHSDDGNIKKLVQQAHHEFARLELANLNPDHGIFSQLFSNIPHQSINWLWPGRIARGKVSIIAGNPGLGKSQLTASLAAIVTTGGIWPVDNMSCQLGNVILLSAEDDPADTIGPRLQAAGADLTKVRFLKCVQTKNKQGKLLEKSFSLKTDIANLDKFLEEVQDVALLIIDPITAYLGETDSYKNAEVRALLSPLSELAAKHNLAIIAISHLNKAAGQDPLMRVSGSLAFVAAARAAFLVAQDPNNDERLMLLPMKNNIGNDKTGLAFSIESYQLESGIYTSRVVWEEDAVDIKAHEIMKPQDDPEETSALKEAIDFLKDELAYFPKTVSKLKKESNDYGLSWRTTLRAKTALKIVTNKSGMDGGWIWSLPKETKASEEGQTKSLASFGEVGLLRQDLNNFKENNEEIGQNLLKEAKDHEEGQINCMATFEKDEHLRQNLNDSEEEAVYFDVDDAEVDDE